MVKVTLGVTFFVRPINFNFMHCLGVFVGPGIFLVKFLINPY